jgi:uncharacterized protein YndB with AHSA1/START domain
MEVVDTAVISASPAAVMHALLDESAGVSHWWLPYLRMQQRGELSFPEVGAVADVTVSPEGALGSRLKSGHFSLRVLEVEENRRMLIEYFDGDFRGTGEWILTPVAPGRTEVRFAWKAIPHGIAARFLSIVRNIPRGHSKVMQEGFRGMERYIKETMATAT